MNPSLTSYLERLSELAPAALDCGDNSCHFAKKISGMRTNGGCRCFSQAGFISRSAIQTAYEMLPIFVSTRTALPKLIEICRIQQEALEIILDDTSDIVNRDLSATALSAIQRLVEEE